MTDDPHRGFRVGDLVKRRRKGQTDLARIKVLYTGGLWRGVGEVQVYPPLNGRRLWNVRFLEKVDEASLVPDPPVAEAKSDLVIIGWQYRIPDRLLEAMNAQRAKVGQEPKTHWWVHTIYNTKAEAQHGGYGGFEGNPLNVVRAVYAREGEAS